jgi:hypothetical protein
LGFRYRYLNARGPVWRSEKVGTRSAAKLFKPKRLQNDVMSCDLTPMVVEP